MRKIRIGNDIAVQWSLVAKGTGEPFVVEGKDIRLTLKNIFGKTAINEFDVAGNTISWTFKGAEQKQVGIYSLEVSLLDEQGVMITTDVCDFVELVACSCEIGGMDATGVHTESIELVSDVDVAAGIDLSAYLTKTEAQTTYQPQEKGKGLSTNDYTTAEKNKLDGLQNYDDTAIKGQLTELSDEVEEVDGICTLANEIISKSYFQKGIKCSGEVRASIKLISGSPNKWKIYRYVNGAFNDELLAEGLNYGDAIEIEVPSGDDGIYLFFTTNNIECEIEYSVVSGLQGAEYEIGKLSKKCSEIETSIADLPWIKDSVENITGDLGKEVKTSKRNNISIYLDNTPTRPTYKVRVLSDNPSTNTFSWYKCTPEHTSKTRLTTKGKIGEWYIIERDDELSSLYIYNTEAGSAEVDQREYTIEYRTVESLTDDVNSLKETSGWSGKTIVCFGDSLTEFKDHDNSKAYSDYIHDIMGADVINLGIGGTQFRRRVPVVETPTTTNEAYAALDIVNMVRACCEQDFTKQINATNYLTQNGIDDNDPIIARMQTIDWSKVDVVTFFGGTNDWHNAFTSWGAEDSNEDKYTFGAINEIVRMIMTTYPHVHVYWFTPIVRWLKNEVDERTEETFSDNIQKGDATLKEFSARIEAAIKKHHIPVCDMYNTLGWNMYNFSQFFTDTDGTHPRKGKGTEQIARKMVAFINANKTF